ncbi:MAG TPA: hypothetical protein VN048_14285 [Verrucomicrobiae bacterium]|jgi:hypothetical protein|nr:hypothetical protein [Verrucomicrobiae bacterium]
MKTRHKQEPRHFQLKILAYGNSYYVDRLARLESALARKPRLLQIDMVGVGEIPADSALLIRSVLVRRNANTQIITNARSSLQGGSVLIWLLGDTRIIRDDARVYFRPVDVSEIKETDETVPWKEDKSLYWDSPTGIDPEEGDYARVLQLINEYLPVKELAGRLIEVPVLRQFGLVENEKVDQFLAAAFGKPSEAAGGSQNSSEEKSNRRKSKSLKPRQVEK